MAGRLKTLWRTSAVSVGINKMLSKLSFPKPKIDIVREEEEEEEEERDSRRVLCDQYGWALKPRRLLDIERKRRREADPRCRSPFRVTDPCMLEIGRDCMHWRVYTAPISPNPKFNPTRDELIHYYITTFSHVLNGDLNQASRRIYSVSTRHYYAFGAIFSPPLAPYVVDLPNVVSVGPDTYMEPYENKRYPWDPFINGQALPCDEDYYPPIPNKRKSDGTRIGILPLPDDPTTN